MMFFILLTVFALLLAIVAALKTQKAEEKVKQRDQDLKQKNDHISDLEQKISRLSKFEVCVNAEDKAAQIVSDAESMAASLRSAATRLKDEAAAELNQAQHDRQFIQDKAKEEAEAELIKAKQEGKEIRAKAKEQAEATISKANIQLNNAMTNAKIVTLTAEDEARRIAGEAYDIAKNVDYYRETLAAIKNTINGYGLKFIKPMESSLDGLAQEFGYTDAGQQLTLTKQKIASLVDSGLAAQCDYAETNRRETAIAFVLDAFNGKVDTIITRLKQDNYGVLQQKVRDAFATVNYLGRPFKNARITKEYLDARLEELRWGAALIAIKNREKEEQRAIKERMREEEKARREYEKAMRDAEKQETSIRKAIEAATAKLEKANEEQRQKYEAQLLALQGQLKEAEEKNQRALSMAQQTKSGHVYIISNIGSFGENVYKIGMTRRLEPLDRVRELGDASVPFPFDVHAMIFSDDAPALETELHKLFAINQVNKVNPRKEFFRLPISDIREYFDKKGVEVQWTILAEAAQYRETLALEESFAKNGHLEKQWVATQNHEMEEIENQTDDPDSDEE